MLSLKLCAKTLISYPISTAINGLGEMESSFQTPRGLHVICEKYQQDAPKKAVFVARQWTGEVFSNELAIKSPERDWILTRVLCLAGLESGFNRGLNAQGVCVDSYKRFIYIHGTADEHLLGQPASHGCIRMANDDILSLYEQVDCTTEVHIE